MSGAQLYGSPISPSCSFTNSMQLSLVVVGLPTDRIYVFNHTRIPSVNPNYPPTHCSCHPPCIHPFVSAPALRENRKSTRCTAFVCKSSDEERVFLLANDDDTDGIEWYCRESKAGFHLWGKLYARKQFGFAWFWAPEDTFFGRDGAQGGEAESV